MSELIIVSMRGCAPCEALKKALRDKRVVFREIDISERPNYRAVPVIEYKSQRFVGTDAFTFVRTNF